MKIQLKKIDNLIIAVVDNSILQRNVPTEGSEVIFEELQGIVDQLNSGLVTDSKEYASLISKFRKIMSSKLAKIEEAKIEKENNIKEETENLAIGSKDKEELLQDAMRIVSIDDRFEHDMKGLTYLKGYSVPIPSDLVKAILDATYNKDSQYTLDSLVNFWQWAILNPNPEARNDLFGWFKTGNFTITNEGLIVAYRCVDIKSQGVSTDLQNFVNLEYTKVKSWKKSPKNYGVRDNFVGYTLIDLKKEPGMASEKEFLGTLSDLYSDINMLETATVYTDNHTHTMTIKIGEEVSMPRKDCDEDRDQSCSRGLHFMSKKYSLRLGREKLVILVNPMNIVAFPNYDNSKGRCCAYMPVGKVELDHKGDIIEMKSGTYDFEYANYTSHVLEEMLKISTFEDLVEEGLISAEIKESDFNIAIEVIKDITDNKFVHVS